MPHRRFLLDSLAYPLSSNIRDVARMDYGRYGRINSAHAGTRDEIERITETSAKSKMMKEGSSYAPRMTIVQLELTSKVWKKLEAIADKDGKQSLSCTACMISTKVNSPRSGGS
jgi:hypothetical protein